MWESTDSIRFEQIRPTAYSCIWLEDFKIGFPSAKKEEWTMHLLSFIQDYTGLIEPAMSYYSINIPKGGQRGGLIMTLSQKLA